MLKTISALYDDINNANLAILALLEQGFKPDTISLIAARPDFAVMDTGGKVPVFHPEEVEELGHSGTEMTAASTEIGAVFGGLGGLLVGLGVIAVPGIDALIATGPLVLALSGLAGASVGAMAGGFSGNWIGTLVSAGIPQSRAQLVSSAVLSGGTLVMMRAESARSRLARSILDRYEPVDVEEEDIEEMDPMEEDFLENDELFMRETYNTGRPPLPGERLFGYQYDTTWESESYLDHIRPPSSDWKNYPDDFTRNTPYFEEHYNKIYFGSGYGFDRYIPAYYYGYRLATEGRSEPEMWIDVESPARRGWEAEYPGTWDEFAEAVQYAWYQLKYSLF